MSGLVLLRPWWLLALLAVIAIAVFRRGPQSGGWQRVIPAQLLAGLQQLGLLGQGSAIRRRIGLAAMALLCIGLSGPAMPRPDAPVFAQTDAIVIAMDLSPSIAAGPALADAQAAAAQILGQNAGRPVGLIVYAGDAYAVAAPTSDPTTLESQIAVLGPDTMPDDGSRPAAAMSVAADMLAGLKRADLVLISDGGGISEAALAEAERLRQAGVTVSALLLDKSAENAPAPDPEALDRLVQGRVAPARDPGQLLSRLGTGSLARDPSLSVLSYRDFGLPITGLAAIPLLLLFRRRA